MIEEFDILPGEEDLGVGMGLEHAEVSEAPRDGEPEVGRGLIQIELADGQGCRWNGGLPVADQGGQARLLESQVGQLDGRPILPQGHAPGIEPFRLRRVLQDAKDSGELPERFALPLATLRLFG